MTDELREAGTQLTEGGEKLVQAVKESETDEEHALSKRIAALIAPATRAGTCLEEAGASLQQAEGVAAVGQRLVTGGEALAGLAGGVGALDPENSEGTLAAQRMLYASQQMIVAGRELSGEKKETPKGKSWLKG